MDNYASAHAYCNHNRGKINWLLYASVMRREFDEALTAFPQNKKYIEEMKLRYMKGDWIPEQP